MATYILAGVQHATGSNKQSTALLSQESIQEFKKCIAPKLTAQSAVFGEGHHTPYLLETSDQDYAWHYDEFGGALNGVRPALGFFDPRQEGNGYKKLRNETAMVSWINRGSELFADRQAPSNVQKLKELLHSESFISATTNSLTSRDIEYARQVHALNRRFDRNYTDAMRRYAPSRDVCVLVAGFTHCFNIAHHTGWKFELLCKPDPVQVVFDFFWIYTYPELLTKTA